MAALEQPLDLTELGIDALKLRRLLHQDLDPNVIADRHLVEQTADLRLHQREALGEPGPLALELRVGWLRRRTGRDRRRGRGRIALAKPELHGTEIWSGSPRCWST